MEEGRYPYGQRKRNDNTHRPTSACVQEIVDPPIPCAAPMMAGRIKKQGAREPQFDVRTREQQRCCKERCQRPARVSPPELHGCFSRRRALQYVRRISMSNWMPAIVPDVISSLKCVDRPVAPPRQPSRAQMPHRSRVMIHDYSAKGASGRAGRLTPVG
jgi:hypothetical protein